MKRTLFVMLFSSILLAGMAQDDTISTNIYQDAGKMGIGTTEPTSALEIFDNVSNGDARYLIKLNNSSTDPYSTCGLRLKAGNGSECGTINFTSETYNDPNQTEVESAMLLGTNGNSVQLRVNQPDGFIRFSTGGLTGAYPAYERMRIDGEGHVGIGTSSPENALSIVGDETGWPGRVLLSVNNTNTSGKSLAYMELKAGSSGNHLVLGHISETYTSNSKPEDLQDFGLVSSNGRGLIVSASRNDLGAGIIKFCNGQNPDDSFIETMRITENGNVGIGTSEPLEKLDINGGLKISNTEHANQGSIRWTGTDFEGYDGNSWLSFTASGEKQWQQNGGNLYRSGGNIGLGTDMPDNALSIVGDETEWPGRVFISVKNISTSGKSAAYIKLQAGETVSGTSLGHISPTYTSNDSYEEIADFGRLTSSGNGLMIDATKPDLSAGIIKFCSGQGPGDVFIERMRIDPSGNLGIGTASPSSRVEIADGDIFISDIERGIIMKSPDGNCWRGTLDNSGTLHFSQVECPGLTPAEGIVSVDQPAELMRLVPNPTRNEVNVYISGDVAGKVLKVYSETGLLVMSHTITDNQMGIGTSELHSGRYFFVAEDTTGRKIASATLLRR